MQVEQVARLRSARYAEIQVARRAGVSGLTCASRGLQMAGPRHSACWWRFSFAGLLLGIAAFSGHSAAGSPQEPKTAQNQTSAATLPRGKKLVLKDGTYQIVREYQRNGERVRYYSLERGDWEELPASMVDWEATAKAEGEAEKSSSAMVEKVHKQEEAARMDNVADIDASLPVGDGAFLPSGEGMFVVEGKSVRILDQVVSGVKTDKKRTIEQILSPVQIVPGKKYLIIAGARAGLRLRTTRPEFYLREAPQDPDHVSGVERSSRAGESGPEVELLRVKVAHNERRLESISSLFGEQVSKKQDVISVQRWEIAPSVYRFTLGAPLPPGEYVLAELLPDGMNLFVWDFGVDGSPDSTKK